MDESAAKHASYKLSLQIARTGYPPTIGESLILPAIKTAFGVACDEQSCLTNVETISLCDRTVSDKIDDISRWVQHTLIERVNQSKWFSIQLHECANGRGSYELIVFVRYIWMNDIQEDFLCYQPRIRDEHITSLFSVLYAYQKTKGIDWSKCVGICTDGARTMCERTSSFITEIREINPKVIWTRRNIHRETLVSKYLSDDFRSVLNACVEMVNFVKAEPSQSHFYNCFYEEMESNHGSLFLHTEKSWLSRGNVLKMIAIHRKDFTLDLRDNSDYVRLLNDETFVLKLAYLADIFSKLNELDVCLQGTDVDTFAVHDKIRAFMKKLVLWKNNIQRQVFDCFETFSDYIRQKQIKVEKSIIASISDHLSKLKEHFDSCFLSEMENYQQMKWISNPFREHDVMTNNRLSTRAKEELIEIFEDDLLKTSFNRKRLVDFWFSVRETYPTVSDEAVKMLLPFISTYSCELGYSTLVNIKSKFNRFPLTNALRLKLTNIEVDINAVMEYKYNTRPKIATVQIQAAK